jgi:hypothetical protein
VGRLIAVSAYWTPGRLPYAPLLSAAFRTSAILVLVLLMQFRWPGNSFDRETVGGQEAFVIDDRHRQIGRFAGEDVIRETELHRHISE